MPHRIAIVLAWAAITIPLAQHHVFWRDEVRALSIALTGEDLLDMLRALHGEGHPAVWYLLLRAAYTVVGRVEILPGVAWLVGFAAVTLFVARAPFRWPTLALFAFGNIAAYEYVVMARNYGISMLLIFAFAMLYPRRQSNGLLLGLILLSLANTNIHSALLVGGLVLLWLIDILDEQGLHWTPAFGHFLLATVLAFVGIIGCGLTVYPPFNDAMVLEHPRWLTGIGMVWLTNWQLIWLLEPTLGAPVLLAIYLPLLLTIFTAVYGLVNSRGAFLAGLTTLLSFMLFFSLVYPSYLRHEALWLVFLLALYWIEMGRNRSPQPASAVLLRAGAGRIARHVGQLSLGILLACQIPGTIQQLHFTLEGVPESSSRDFAVFIAARPEFARATVLADPDFLIEPLPYYLGNRTYLMREHRLGRYVTFSKAAQQSLSLDQILDNAAKLKQDDGNPVIILLHKQLDAVSSSAIETEGPGWVLVAPSDQAHRFLTHVRLLGRFRPAQTDESFEAYEYLGDFGAETR